MNELAFMSLPPGDTGLEGMQPSGPMGPPAAAASSAGAGPQADPENRDDPSAFGQALADAETRQETKATPESDPETPNDSTPSETRGDQGGEAVSAQTTAAKPEGPATHLAKDGQPAILAPATPTAIPPAAASGASPPQVGLPVDAAKPTHPAGTAPVVPSSASRPLSFDAPPVNHDLAPAAGSPTDGPAPRVTGSDGPAVRPVNDTAGSTIDRPVAAGQESRPEIPSPSRAEGVPTRSDALKTDAGPTPARPDAGVSPPTATPPPSATESPAAAVTAPTDPSRGPAAERAAPAEVTTAPGQGSAGPRQVSGGAGQDLSSGDRQGAEHQSQDRPAMSPPRAEAAAAPAPEAPAPEAPAATANVTASTSSTGDAATRVAGLATDPVTAPAATQAAATRAAEPMTTPPQIEGLAEQLRVHVRPGMSRVSFQVDPPEYGRLHVQLVLKQGKLTARITAESADVARVLEGDIARVRQAIGGAALHVDDVDVRTRDGGHGQDPSGARSAQHGLRDADDLEQRRSPGRQTDDDGATHDQDGDPTESNPNTDSRDDGEVQSRIDVIV